VLAATDALVDGAGVADATADADADAAVSVVTGAPASTDAEGRLQATKASETIHLLMPLGG
jgi:hypothetical protein